jgi:hypothetical protein
MLSGLSTASASASTSSSTSLQVDTAGATENAITATSIASTEHESIQSAGKMIQDLFHPDNAKINATLDALSLDLHKKEKKCGRLVTAGGCFALVHVMENCLGKANAGIPACDQVTKLNKAAELTTLKKTLRVITNLTFHHEESNIEFAAIVVAWKQS